MSTVDPEIVRLMAELKAASPGGPIITSVRARDTAAGWRNAPGWTAPAAFPSLRVVTHHE